MHLNKRGNIKRPAAISAAGLVSSPGRPIIRLFLFICLFLCRIRAIQEGHDLAAGAVLVRSEQTFPDTVCDIFFRSPRNRIRAIAVFRYILECHLSVPLHCTKGAEKEGYALSPGADRIRTESVVSGPHCDPLLQRPGNRLRVVRIRCTSVGRRISFGSGDPAARHRKAII